MRPAETGLLQLQKCSETKCSWRQNTFLSKDVTLEVDPDKGAMLENKRKKGLCVVANHGKFPESDLNI